MDPKFDNGKAIYLFNINKKFDLDGDFKFNTARLINHSAILIAVWCRNEDLDFCFKKYKKNEELSYDYGFSFDKDYKDYPCKCHSKIVVDLS